MNRLQTWLYDNAKIRNLVLAVMLIIPLNALAFPWMSAHFRELSGGVATLDVQFAYFPDQAIQIIDNLNDQARAFYLLIEWTADLLFPITYATLFGLLLALILNNSTPPGHPFRSLALLPYLMMAADYTENTTISLLLVSYPTFLPALLAWLAAIASFLKWLFGGLVGVALVISLIGMVRGFFNQDHPKGA